MKVPGVLVLQFSSSSPLLFVVFTFVTPLLYQIGKTKKATKTGRINSDGGILVEDDERDLLASSTYRFL